MLKQRLRRLVDLPIIGEEEGAESSVADSEGTIESVEHSIRDDTGRDDTGLKQISP